MAVLHSIIDVHIVNLLRILYLQRYVNPNLQQKESKNQLCEV